MKRVLGAVASLLLVGCQAESDHCDFPTSDETLGVGQTQDAEVLVANHRLGQLQAAGWTYTIHRWKEDSLPGSKDFIHVRTDLGDGTHPVVVEQLEHKGELKVTLPNGEVFGASPVGCA